MVLDIKWTPWDVPGLSWGEHAGGPTSVV